MSVRSVVRMIVVSTYEGADFMGDRLRHGFSCPSYLGPSWTSFYYVVIRYQNYVVTTFYISLGRTDYMYSFTTFLLRIFFHHLSTTNEQRCNYVTRWHVYNVIILCNHMVSKLPCHNVLHFSLAGRIIYILLQRFCYVSFFTIFPQLMSNVATT